MPRFFVTPAELNGSTATLVGEEARHITRSLRMAVGEDLTLCDQQGWDYHCKITQLTPQSVVVDVLEKTPNQTEPTVAITLYQALPKGDKLEFILQKAVELGATKVVPVLTSRCISRPKGAGVERKTQRLQKIALEAAKQSGRGIVPQVGELLSYSQALSALKQHALGLLFYEGATTPLSGLLSPLPGDVGMMIGSEGGFSPEEITQATEAEVKIASLGRRILRCETAPLVGITAVLFAAGEL